MWDLFPYQCIYIVTSRVAHYQDRCIYLCAYLLPISAGILFDGLTGFPSLWWSNRVPITTSFQTLLLECKLPQIEIPIVRWSADFWRTSHLLFLWVPLLSVRCLTFLSLLVTSCPCCPELACHYSVHTLLCDLLEDILSIFLRKGHIPKTFCILKNVTIGIWYEVLCCNVSGNCWRYLSCVFYLCCWETPTSVLVSLYLLFSF